MDLSSVHPEIFTKTSLLRYDDNREHLAAMPITQVCVCIQINQSREERLFYVPFDQYAQAIFDSDFIEGQPDLFVIGLRFNAQWGWHAIFEGENFEACISDIHRVFVKCDQTPADSWDGEF